MISRSTYIELRVRYAETDRMGVVYHANYLVWCEIGRTEHIRALGRSYRALEEDGVMLAVADVAIRYHASARYDDRVRVATTVRNIRSRSITFDYLITNADTAERLATARTVLVALNRAGQVAAMPPDLRALLRSSQTDANP